MYFGDGNVYRMEASINAAKSLEVKEICDGVEWEKVEAVIDWIESEKGDARQENLINLEESLNQISRDKKSNVCVQNVVQSFMTEKHCWKFWHWAVSGNILFILVISVIIYQNQKLIFANISNLSMKVLV